jgi:transcriptional regulator with XRE-family HTH domain
MRPAEARGIRRRLGLTQADLARRCGVTRVTVARWERGLATIGPTAVILLRLLAANAKKER